MTEVILAAPIPQGSRGRNGWFTPRWLTLRAELEERTLESGQPVGYGSHVELTVHSQREGKREPIVLRLSLEDALILSGAIQQEVERVLPPRTSVRTSVAKEPARAPAAS